MLILIALIIVSIWWALVFSIYSIFNPFIENLWDIKDYNIAYYWAIAGIERWNLALRYHDAWFEWAGWWTWQNNDFWPSSDHLTGDYWRLAEHGNTMHWNIESRLDWSIPESNRGNIDYNLQYTWSNYWGHSKNFNQLWYDMTEEFMLYFDDTTDSSEYYTWVDDSNIEHNLWISNLSWTIRLPPRISKEFWWWSIESLCTSAGCDLSWDWITNDIVVNWTISWYDDNDNSFTINPTIDVDYTNYQVENEDTAIREDVINDMTQNNNNLSFSDWDDGFTPLQLFRSDQPDEHNIVPSTHPFTWKNFDEIFDDWEYLKIRFSLVNLLQTFDEDIYPFLEYKFDFWTEIPDRFFTINWVSRVWDYEVEIIQRKPTSERTAAGDFTILF